LKTCLVKKNGMFSCNMCILELYLGDNISLGPESGSCVLETIAPSGNAFPTTHKHDIKNKNITHTSNIACTLTRSCRLILGRIE